MTDFNTVTYSTLLQNGNFVIVWIAHDAETDLKRKYGAIFDSNG